MFKSHTPQEGYQNPGMFIPPNGYNMNSQYQSFGPNQMNNANMVDNYDNNYEERISRLERQVRNLDTRLQKIENTNTDTTDNFYMI